MRWQWLHFSELSLEQLYDALALREEVFSVEQSCTAVDLDGLDKDAFHLLGYQGDELVAYARVLPTGVYKKDVVSFGRLIVCKELRNQGVGKELMQQIIDFIRAELDGVAIKFSAQLYLQKSYESFGFSAYGDVYDDGGIPHIDMLFDNDYRSE